MADYKIGQILTSTEDVEIEKALSGEKVIIPKVTRLLLEQINLLIISGMVLFNH